MDDTMILMDYARAANEVLPVNIGESEGLGRVMV
jgi:hypothetical protein